MKKFISIVLAAALCTSVLAACSSTPASDANTSSETNQAGETSDKKVIVCTTFPQYDWTMNILGDKADLFTVIPLVDSGDLHNYQPSVADIADIASSDLFIMTGGPSDTWTEDALKTTTNENQQVIMLVDALGSKVKEEEAKEGMEPEEGEEAESDAHEDEEEIDEHVWLSLKNAADLTDAIAEAIYKIDPENKAVYEENVEHYKAELAQLDAAYEETVKASSNDTLIFADRFPFRYLVDDYDLDYYAAFAGCSAETEASFSTIIFLAEKLDELKLDSVCMLRASQDDIARTVIENTTDKNQSIVVFDSMENRTTKDIEAGDTYLAIMQQNLDALSEALA